MRDDYKKQLKDYRQDYTDDEIRHRLKQLKILEQNTTTISKGYWELKYQMN